MKKLLSFRKAAHISLGLFYLLVIFHLAVIIGILLFNYVPLEYLWGGRMQSKDELLNFEFASLVISFFCILIVLIRIESIRIPILVGPSRIFLWLLSLLFILNTFGNLVAVTLFEKLFAILTAALTVLCLRMAMEPLDKKE